MRKKIDNLVVRFLILLIFTIILSDIVNKLHIFNAIIEIAVIY